MNKPDRQVRLCVYLTKGKSGAGILIAKDVENKAMPWYNGDFPPSYKNQPVRLREKATEIANELLIHRADEGIAIATGLKRAREFFANKSRKEPGNKPAGKSKRKPTT